VNKFKKIRKEKKIEETIYDENWNDNAHGYNIKFQIES